MSKIADLKVISRTSTQHYKSAPENLPEIARQLGVRQLSRTGYLKQGRYSVRTLEAHFARWEEAADAARIAPAYRRPVDDRELFDNLRQLWTRLGHQPSAHQVKKPMSLFSLDVYLARFGKFNHALRAFAQYLDPANVSPGPVADAKKLSRKTTRHVNDSLRFKVMRRDRFRCCACGRSPATHAGVVLEIDHKKPWSAGGETVMSNLQTLCKKCNRGKSDLKWRAK